MKTSALLSLVLCLISHAPVLLQVHGFFKGMMLPVTTISMTSSVVFGTYRNCLQGLAQIRGIGAHNTKLDVFLSGLAAGVAQV